MRKRKKRKEDLEIGEESENRELQRQRKRMNREMAMVTYIFMFLFVFMAGYVIWFLSGDTDQILNNTQNRRQSLLAERVQKGKILSADGKVLAKTDTDKKGEDCRVYPYDGLFSHVVGRTEHGKTGLEATESYTMLTTGIHPLTGILNELKGKKNPGNDVVTTLNVSLTQVASRALGSHKGAVVVMDPGTGKILAMVSKPTYNPNKVNERWESLVQDSESESALYNRATQGLYPPGSTFKLYTLLQYIRENEDVNSYRYQCTGKIGEGTHAIHCYGNEVHGTIDLKRAFAKSCNAAFSQIGTGLKRAEWMNLCNSLYYNKTLPIKEIEQKTAQFQISEETDNGDVMQMAIGQGAVLTTPLQNAYLVAAAVNGGVFMKPYVVDHIQDAYGGTVKEYGPVSAGNPITAEEAKLLRQYMRETVVSGTARALNTTRYKAGGKTGSAQFKEGSSDSHAWFVGYAQKGDRKLVVSIIVEGAGTGSAYAVPIARSIFDQYF